MSKTDKDTPFWVQNTWHGEIDHDHRTGECRVSDDQRDRWPAWNHHYAKCAKRVRVEFTCTKDDPHHSGRYWSRRAEQTCWTLTRDCHCPIPESWKREEHGCNGHYVRLGCIGHVRIERDDSIPCSCDNRPEPATCVPTWHVGRYYTYGGVPSEFVRSVYHRPERRRERDNLNDARRLYNSGDDLDGYDFVNRQARNSARWMYW
jgi:hypothetical protein